MLWVEPWPSEMIDNICSQQLVQFQPNDGIHVERLDSVGQSH